METNYPISTGEAARRLGTNEPRLSDALRRGRIDPPPQMVGGRRIWRLDDLRRAARALGVEFDPADAQREGEAQAT
ncbi:MAG: hypothetical protein IT453_10995 [Planctomycetes bacterium]|nr:hypothetical protein [Planctomycetota bacterium]